LRGDRASLAPRSGPADLVFHLLVLLRGRGLSLASVVDRLIERPAPAQASSTDG
jgi:phosphoribosyl-ATP pyrophosphohydrolase